MNEQNKEALIILQEEAAEVIVEVSKCFRFGPDQMLKGTDVTNIQKLEKEIGDFYAMVDILLDQKFGVSKSGIEKAKKQKFEKLKVYSNLNFANK